jgi:hypothetical protein
MSEETVRLLTERVETVNRLLSNACKESLSWNDLLTKGMNSLISDWEAAQSE